MIKINLHKAYDYIKWIFLEHVILELGFPVWFVGWIMKCVKVVNYTIMINGESIPPFDAAKGMR